ncbi:MAG: DNA polymerase III subunit gamma/tau [Clostridia bacterium]|nr:DNA polymerase III subunit gamma/tau [Clostridia bacterium]
MGYLAIYRKYRPDTFDKVIGQDHVVKTLVNQIETGRIGHAYLFTGTRGTGKTSIAKIFAKAINCTSPVNGSPCGKCATCKSLSQASNIDVIEIDAASNNGVNEIRDLREKVQYPPVNCKYKVYIVDEVHMLTTQAFNALLKTLEEPPKHAVFILATTEVHKMPQTILSRCMRFDFRLVDLDTIAKQVASIYDDLGKPYTDEAVYAIAKAGEGSVRDALSVADTCLSISDGKLTYQDVMLALGATGRDKLTEFVSAILSSDAGKVLSVIDELTSLGKSVGLLVKDVEGYLRELIIVKTCQDADKILKLPKDVLSKLKDIDDSTTKERVLRAMEVFSLVEADLKYSNHPRTLFETASLKACAPQEDYDIGALLARITELEKTLKDIVKNGVTVSNDTPKTIKEVENPAPVATVKETKPETKVAKVVKDTPSKDEVLPISKSGLTADQILGRIMVSLRKNGEIMLWSVMQGVTATIKDDTLVITASGEGDEEVIGTDLNKQLIKKQLLEYTFDIEVKGSPKVKALNQVDEEIERYKKIFGDDIIIVK